MKSLLIVPAILAATLVPATVFAQANQAANANAANTSAEWMDVGELVSKMQAEGYTVREVERDDGDYEVEMTDANGMRVEARLDRRTGEIVNRDHDD